MMMTDESVTEMFAAHNALMAKAILDYEAHFPPTDERAFHYVAGIALAMDLIPHMISIAARVDPKLEDRREPLEQAAVRWLIENGGVVAYDPTGRPVQVTARALTADPHEYADGVVVVAAAHLAGSKHPWRRHPALCRAQEATRDLLLSRIVNKPQLFDAVQAVRLEDHENLQKARGGVGRRRRRGARGG